MNKIKERWESAEKWQILLVGVGIGATVSNQLTIELLILIFRSLI